VPSSERVSLHDAAERLGVHYMTVYHYVRTGRLAAQRRGATWSVAVDDLAALRAGAVHRGTRPPVPRASRLADRLVAGDEAGAWRVVEDAMASGRDPAAVHTEILVPARRRIGERWERDEFSIGDEHRASVIAARLVGRLGPRFARRGRHRGAVVLGAVEGERHALPGAILADLLRGRGFEVLDLGIDTPAASFVEAALAADRLVAVLVGATSAGREEALGEAIGRLHGAGMTASVLAGGRAVPDADAARRLGADGWSGTSATEAVAAVDREV
jgi:excisionase family DNA binding protein